VPENRIAAGPPLALEAFDFELPRERIAQHPQHPRDGARLLQVGRHALADRLVRDLPALLEPGDILVLNDTKVIPARLRGTRTPDRIAGCARGGAKVELTLHREVAPDRWRAFAKPARKLSPGDRIELAPGFSAEVAAKGAEGEVTVRFELRGADLLAALERHGEAPLPPYIKRGAGPDLADRADYQTLYARAPGAVAAPTAGLHFTQALFDALEARGVGRAMLTLHVGAGTFLPVKVADLRDHTMQGEYGVLDAATIERIEAARAQGGRVVAVGSTSLRLLESAVDGSGRLRPFAGETSLFILPGYRFKIVDLLLTNFHLPRSTLFALVAAFAGLARMHAAYRHAIASGYRFYSYGDCCLIERSDGP
jgi:S-adenosylmethionine:tRNA ribosyltransferase-isomerase